MKKKSISLFAAAILLVACAIPVNPIVSSYNGDSVTLVTSAFSDQKEVKEKTQAEANRICAKGHKKRAEYASTRTNSETYEQRHLYICLN